MKREGTWTMEEWGRLVLSINEGALDPPQRRFQGQSQNSKADPVLGSVFSLPWRVCSRPLRLKSFLG